MSLLQIHCLPSRDELRNSGYQRRIIDKYEHHGTPDIIRLPKLGKIIPMMSYKAILRDSFFTGYEITIAASDEDEFPKVFQTLIPKPVKHNNISKFIPTFIDFFGNSSLPAFATRNDITPGYYTEHYRRYNDRRGQIFLTGLYVASEEKKGQVVRHNDFYLYILGNGHTDLKEENLIEVTHLKYNYGQLLSIRQEAKQVVYYSGYLKSILDENQGFACEFHNSRLVGAQNPYYHYQIKPIKLVECLLFDDYYKIFPNHDLGSISFCHCYNFNIISDNLVDSPGENAMFISRSKVARPYDLIVPTDSRSDSYDLMIGLLKYIDEDTEEDVKETEESEEPKKYHGPLFQMKYCYLQNKSGDSKNPKDESDEELDESGEHQFDKIKLKDGLNILSTSVTYFLNGIKVKKEQYQQYWLKLLSQYYNQFPEQFPFEIVTLILQYNDNPELMCKFYIDSLLSGKSPFIEYFEMRSNVCD
jgi:hypothetical protein